MEHISTNDPTTDQFENMNALAVQEFRDLVDKSTILTPDLKALLMRITQQNVVPTNVGELCKLIREGDSSED